MILKTLTLNNFKQYTKLELDFREGLVGIVGRNGSGKSSLFEGVLLCLFGTASSEKGFYKSSWAKDAEAVALELSFEIQLKHYRVRREFRGKALAHQATLYDYDNQLIASGATPVNQEVARLIGMDKDAFTRSIFSGQKELGIISGTTGEDRKRMVRKMVGLDKLDHIQKVVREDKNTTKKQIQGQEALVLDAESLKAKKEQLKTLDKDSKATEKDLVKYQKELKQAEQLYLKEKQSFESEGEKYRQFTQLDGERIKYAEALVNLAERKKEAQLKQSQLLEVEKEIEEQGPLIIQYEQKKKELSELEVLREKQVKLESLNQLESRLSQELTQLAEQVRELQTAISHKTEQQKQVQTINQQIEQHRLQIEQEDKAYSQLVSRKGELQGRINERQQRIAKIEELGREAQCPTCLQPLVNSYDDTLRRLQAEIAEYENQAINELQKDIEKQEQLREVSKTQMRQFQEQFQNLQANIRLIEAKEKELAEQQNSGKVKKQERQDIRNQIEALGKIAFDPSVYQALKGQVQEGEAIFIAFRAKEQELAQRPELLQQISKLEERMVKGQAIVKEREQGIKTLQFTPEKYDTAQKSRNEAEQQRDTIRQTVNQQTHTLHQLQSESNGIRLVLEQDQQNRQTIENQRIELEQLETLDGIFSTFKGYILNKVKPTIAQHASQLFQQITKGRYEAIEVDDNFEFQILEDGAFYPIQRFSGGEVDLANLCLRIGISKAIAELSGSQSATQFLGFDEIFGSQDEERRFEILLALDLLKEQYRQIYIISHIHSVKEHFPNILEVHKGEMGSEVNWR